MKKDIVVIGSGVGGSACAGTLQKAGFSVSLYEAHPFPGGRCSTFERDGFHCDFGVHMFSRGNSGPHGQVNRILDGDLKWEAKDPACRVLGAARFDFPLNIKPFLTRAWLARKLGLRIKNIYGAYTLFNDLFKGTNFEENDDITLMEYVCRYTDDNQIHLFMNCLSQLYFALSSKEASAGEFIWCFSRMFNEASFGYPRGGSVSIPKSFLEGLSRFGGRTAFNTPIKKIRIENNRAVGVETETGFQSADIVISNMGLKRTIDLVGKKNFPEPYVTRAGNYRFSNSYITIKYALDKNIVAYPVVFHMPNLPAEKAFDYIEKRTVPEDPYIFMPVPSNQDPQLSPDGKQIVIAGTAAPPSASQQLCEAILDAVHNRVCELFPGFENAIRWQTRSTRSDTTEITQHPEGEAIGIGQHSGQTGRFRPSLKTPIEGLWLVGADAGSRGIGTEMAAGSALNLFQMINDTY